MYSAACLGVPTLNRVRDQLVEIDVVILAGLLPLHLNRVLPLQRFTRGIEGILARFSDTDVTQHRQSFELTANALESLFVRLEHFANECTTVPRARQPVVCMLGSPACPLPPQTAARRAVSGRCSASHSQTGCTCPRRKPVFLATGGVRLRKLQSSAAPFPCAECPMPGTRCPGSPGTLRR